MNFFVNAYGVVNKINEKKEWCIWMCHLWCILMKKWMVMIKKILRFWHSWHIVCGIRNHLCLNLLNIYFLILWIALIPNSLTFLTQLISIHSIFLFNKSEKNWWCLLTMAKFWVFYRSMTTRLYQIFWHFYGII